MYKKFIMQLFLCNMIFVAGWFCSKGIQMSRLASTPAFQVKLTGNYIEPKSDKVFGAPKKAASGQRVVDYEVIERKSKYNLSDEDYEVLLKIVQAEAGSEDVMGKMLVAGVVLNRMESKKFPDTVKEVVFQNENGVYQFSPVSNGSYYAAVDRVLMGEDVTQGALYFAARKYANPDRMKWFDCSLVRLFEHGGHEFFS